MTNFQEIELSAELDPDLPHFLSSFDSRNSVDTFGPASETLDILNTATMAISTTGIISLDNSLTSALNMPLDSETYNAGLLESMNHSSNLGLNASSGGQLTGQFEFVDLSHRSFGDSQPGPSNLHGWPPKLSSTSVINVAEVEKRPIGQPKKPNAFGPPLTVDELQDRMPRLRNPNAEHGEKTTSLAQWLASGRTESQGGSSSQETTTVPVSNTIIPDIPTWTIIPDVGESEFFTMDDAQDDDAIGSEDFAVPLSDFNDIDPGLSNLEDERNNKRQKADPPPQWFQKTLEEKLRIIEKCDTNGAITFYEEHQSFWVPRKAKWFRMRKSKSLEPELLYDFAVCYWDPQVLTDIKCPICKSAYLTRHGLQRCPHRCVSWENCFYMIGAWYKCPDCLHPVSGKITVTFMSWDSRIIASLPKSLAVEFPVVLTQCSALSKPILALERALFQKGLGSSQFCKIIKTLHLRHFDQLHLQYLDMIYDNRNSNPWKNQIFRPFSQFADPQGYAGYVPSSQWF